MHSTSITTEQDNHLVFTSIQVSLSFKKGKQQLIYDESFHHSTYSPFDRVSWPPRP